MTRRERLERKIEKRKEWAEKARKRSAGRFGSAKALADQIPFGQPILVGHHSERRARRDAERIRGNMDKGCEEQRKAEHHESKASGLEDQLERTVFSDDEDAIEKLEARIAENEKVAETYVRINKAWRKTKGDAGERVAAMVESGAVSPRLAEQIAKTMALCPWLDKPFNTTNVRARIRRDKERIEEVKRRGERVTEAEDAGGVSVKSAGDGYVVITFAEKPEREILNALKAAGFWWRGGSWTGRRDSLPECVTELAGVVP